MQLLETDHLNFFFLCRPPEEDSSKGITQSLCLSALTNTSIFMQRMTATFHKTATKRPFTFSQLFNNVKNSIKAYYDQSL